MPEVLSGSPQRLTVADLKRRAADAVGHSISNARFGTACLDFIMDTIREMQLRWPQLRSVVVFDAPFTLIAGESTYDVRDTEANGGFGWGHIYQLLRLKIPDLCDDPLEMLSVDQYRHRAYLDGEEGVPQAVVEIDANRVKIVPTPDQDYEGVGDFTQLISIPTDGGQSVDWVVPWDVVLKEGVLYHAFRWSNPENPSLWASQRRIWQETLDSMWRSEVSSAKSRQVTMTRHLRNRGARLPNDVYLRRR